MNLPVTASTQLAFDAAIFDMDGVLTQTASVHSSAWKRMFDEYLRERAKREGVAFEPFSHHGDYLRYVDGRPRYQGVKTFLASRGIELPFGSPDDRPGAETVCGLGNRKNTLFNEIVANEGVALYASTVQFIEQLQAAAVHVGLATSSKNSDVILSRSGTRELFETVVDGIVSERMGLAGKPAPDIFVTASANLGVAPGRAIVVEDAVSGVQAASRGGFAFVIGLAREGNSAELAEQGADIVATDLSEIDLTDLNARILIKRAKRC